jgi:hypothetical protein
MRNKEQWKKSAKSNCNMRKAPPVFFFQNREGGDKKGGSCPSTKSGKSRIQYILFFQQIHTYGVGSLLKSVARDISRRSFFTSFFIKLMISASFGNVDNMAFSWVCWFGDQSKEKKGVLRENIHR